MITGARGCENRRTPRARCAAFAALTACNAATAASAGFLEANEARKSYGTFSPDRFVQARFSEGGSSAGGIVTWSADYSDGNYYKLLRPMEDVATYCRQVAGGRWSMLETFAGKPELEPTPDIRAGATTYPGGLSAAQQRGAFGRFACAVPGTNGWSISITPRALRPGSAGNPATAAVAQLELRVVTPASTPSTSAVPTTAPAAPAEASAEALTEAGKALAQPAASAVRSRTWSQRLAELNRRELELAHAHGQKAIAQRELGVQLCEDVTLAGTEAVIMAFLEDVNGSNIQLRINSVQSSDGKNTWRGHVHANGVDFAPGNIVWSSADAWRACRVSAAELFAQ